MGAGKIHFRRDSFFDWLSALKMSQDRPLSNKTVKVREVSLVAFQKYKVLEFARSQLRLGYGCGMLMQYENLPEHYIEIFFIVGRCCCV